jgi:hypothetical protein
VTRGAERAGRRQGLAPLLAAAALAGLQGCPQRPTELPPLPGPLVRVQHASGLHVDVPASRVAADQTPQGIRLRPREAAQLRRPWSIELALVGGPGPRIDGGRDWGSGGRTLHQGPVKSADGGSGGSLQTVDAWFSCGAGHVAARFQQQAERADELDLEAAWRLVLSAGCAEPAAPRR